MPGSVLDTRHKLSDLMPSAVLKQARSLAPIRQRRRLGGTRSFISLSTVARPKSTQSSPRPLQHFACGGVRKCAPVQALPLKFLEASDSFLLSGPGGGGWEGKEWACGLRKKTEMVGESAAQLARPVSPVQSLSLGATSEAEGSGRNQHRILGIEAEATCQF